MIPYSNQPCMSRLSKSRLLLCLQLLFIRLVNKVFMRFGQLALFTLNIPLTCSATLFSNYRRYDQNLFYTGTYVHIVYLLYLYVYSMVQYYIYIKLVSEKIVCTWSRQIFPCVSVRAHINHTNSFGQQATISKTQSGFPS